MPSTLRELGLDERDIAIMSGKCTSGGSVTFPSIAPMGRAEVEEIYRACL